MIGVFLVLAATAGQRHVELSEAIGEAVAGELMAAPVVLSVELDVGQARAAVATFPAAGAVVTGADGAVLGLLSPSRLRRRASVRGATVPVPLIEVDQPAARLLEQPEFAAAGVAIVVDAARRPLGVVSVAELERRGRPRPALRAAGASR